MDDDVTEGLATLERVEVRLSRSGKPDSGDGAA